MSATQDMKIERYKYVLSQKQSLNEKTFKIASFYQGALILAAGGQFEVIRYHYKKDISAELARQASMGIFFIMIVVSAISLLMILGGIFAWHSYRIEENLYLPSEDATSSSIGSSSFIRWYETYIILAILIALSCHAYALFWVVLPALP